MSEDLEQKVGFWTGIEKDILDKPADALRNEMLEHLKFIYDNFGTPKEWYSFSNPKQDEINEKISRLQNIRLILLQNPNKVKELYDIIPGIKRNLSKNEADRDFAKFYMAMRDGYLMNYGEPKNTPGGQVGGVWHPYTNLKNDICWLAIYLDKGATNTADFTEEYSQKAGKQPERQYG